MTDKFSIQWQAADGYVGGRRPQETRIAAEDIPEGASDRELEDLFYELLEEDFRQKIRPEADNFDEFMTWARKVAGEEQ